MRRKEGSKMNKILVIDDDPGIRLLYTEEFIDEGYDVVTYEGGKELMNVIKKEAPDLVVLDIGLGEGSGLDILRDIRNTYNLPVILCTAYHHLTYDVRTVAADYCLLKRSDTSDLKLKVRMAFEGMRRFNFPGRAGGVWGLKQSSCAATANGPENKELSDWCYSICAHVQKQRRQALYNGG
jgi:DNA-binding response OmpR family regulator